MMSLAPAARPTAVEVSVELHAQIGSGDAWRHALAASVARWHTKAPEPQPARPSAPTTWMPAVATPRGAPGAASREPIATVAMPATPIDTGWEDHTTPSGPIELPSERTRVDVRLRFASEPPPFALPRTVVMRDPRLGTPSQPPVPALPPSAAWRAREWLLWSGVTASAFSAVVLTVLAAVSLAG